MGDGSFNLEIGAALDKFEAQIGKVPAEVAAAASKAGKSLETLGKSGTDSAKNTATQWDKAALKIGTALGSVFGGGKYVAATHNLAEGFGEMEGTLGALGPAAFAASLGVAAIGAGAVGVYKIGEALVDAVVQADKLVDTLKPYRDSGIFPAIPPDQVQTLHEAKAAYDALEIVWDEIIVQVGTRFAPTLLGLEKGLIEVGLAASHMVGIIADDIGKIDEWRGSLNAVEKASFDLATGGLFQTTSGLAALSAEVGTADDAFAGYSDKADALIGVQTKINDKLRDGGRAAKEYATWLGALEQIGQLNAAATEDELDAQGKLDRAYMDQVTALQKIGDEDAKRTETAAQHAAVREAIAHTEAAIGADYAYKTAQTKAAVDAKATDTQIANAQRGADELAKLQADGTALDHLWAANRIKDANAVRDAALLASSSMIGLFDQAAQIVEAKIETQVKKELAAAKKKGDAWVAAARAAKYATSDEKDAAVQAAEEKAKAEEESARKKTRAQRRAARLAWDASQALAASQAAISAAQAIIVAWADPLTPGPLKIAEVAAAAAAGLAAEATIVSATPPTIAHTGTLAPDEFITRRDGEITVNQRGSQNHAHELVELNRTGRLPGADPGPQHVHWTVDGRKFADVVQQSLRKLPGPLGAIASMSPSIGWQPGGR